MEEIASSKGLSTTFTIRHPQGSVCDRDHVKMWRTAGGGEHKVVNFPRLLPSPPSPGPWPWVGALGKADAGLGTHHIIFRVLPPLGRMCFQSSDWGIQRLFGYRGFTLSLKVQLM